METKHKRMYVEIRVEPMNCFSEPVTIIYIRDVSDTLNTINLKRKNVLGLKKLERVEINTRTLSHEIRSPLGSIITIMGLLIRMQGGTRQQQNKIQKLQKQVKSQANLLMHLVQDILDIDQIT